MNSASLRPAGVTAGLGNSETLPPSGVDFVESTKVFMLSVDTPENLDRFGYDPGLWRAP